MYLQHKTNDSHTQRNRSRQLRELVVARWQYAVLKDTGRDDITLGWYEYATGKFRKGKVTWPNVRASRHEANGRFLYYERDEVAIARARAAIDDILR